MTRSAFCSPCTFFVQVPRSVAAVVFLACVHAMALPVLKTGDASLDQAFDIACRDVTGNFHPYQAGALGEKSMVMMAGAGYDTPWTRDAAINTWNAGGALWPEVARNTLLSTLEKKEGRWFIGGQYWDAIIWASGAWEYFVVTGDEAFLRQAFEATTQTLAQRETDEFDVRLGLFRGPEVYGDGIAAYPDRYAGKGASSSILKWGGLHATGNLQGYGLPMCTLSLNCIYLHTYELLGRMASAMGRQADPSWLRKAESLRKAINENFWNQKRGTYDALIDPWGKDERQEALGIAFSVLFDVADADRSASLFRHIVTTPAGMPVLWPTYSRYSAGYGRHSGTVWPHAQAFWADAAAVSGHADFFAQELTLIADKAVRDGQFYEIYHPISGESYGGLQEYGDKGIVSWKSLPHQTWSATGYIRLILRDLFGLRYDEHGIGFQPVLPWRTKEASLSGLEYRSATLDIRLKGCGRRIVAMTINGQPAPAARLEADVKGRLEIELELAP